MLGDFKRCRTSRRMYPDYQHQEPHPSFLLEIIHSFVLGETPKQLEERLNKMLDPNREIKQACEILGIDYDEVAASE